MQQIASYDLLIEFLVEELPPLNLEQTIGNGFANNLYEKLKSVLTPNSKLKSFITPRRFGVIINDVLIKSPDKKNTRKGPAIKAGLINGVPTEALIGFSKSCNLSIGSLLQNPDGYFYAEQIIKGQALEEILPDAIIQSLKQLQISKNMRWGNNDYYFIRPVHNLMILHGNQVICKNVQILGLQPNNYTYGHRFMSNGKILIDSPQSYEEIMLNQGKVIISFESRKALIKEHLENKAIELNSLIADVPGLLDEVAAIIEYPVILQGQFNSEFLKVPKECLILSMAKNQKYFALLDREGRLSNKFLFVTNLLSKSPQTVISGNEKVLTARLNDAKFFFETDKRYPLTKFVEKLSNVIYHNKLGSQLERIMRLQNIADGIAKLGRVSPEIATHTAYLLKADLTTEMVNEFPELQGVMGKYYALINNESEEIAHAIEQHYYPRFSNDELPNGKLAIVMSLCDKLEALVGLWGIGYQPTGEKDPFGLRRAALGIARILLDNDFDLNELLKITYSSFDDNLGLNPNTIIEVRSFILERLANYLANVKKYPQTSIQSVLSSYIGDEVVSSHIHLLTSLLDKLQNFADNSSNQLLLQASKRIENILKTAKFNTEAPIVPTLFEHSIENKIYTMLSNNSVSTKDWDSYFNELAKFNEPITEFFDNVMVMADNLEVRNNRLILLLKLDHFLNQFCKLSDLTS